MLYHGIIIKLSLKIKSNLKSSKNGSTMNKKNKLRKRGKPKVARKFRKKKSDLSRSSITSFICHILPKIL